MRILVLSDLHLEFAPIDLSRIDWSKVNVTVLAGDCGPRERAFDLIEEQIPVDVPCVVVNGNHDYYKSSIEETEERCRERVRSLGNRVVHYLQNEYAVIGEVAFLGATLWTDYNLYGTPVKSMDYANERLNDHYLIEFQGRIFQPEHARDFHEVSLAWLRGELTKFNQEGVPTAVVTHHAPSGQSSNLRYVGDPLSPAFCSNLEEFIGEHAPRLWLHGHTHHSVDYTIGTTHVVSNQRGYPREGCGFQLDKVVEI